ncbi:MULTISPECIES: DUF485 domain-containing protein [unclassified Rhodococcus (in: high G+C Gram-positive bacteria)]|uniref:DUF485 domain-containing protein n=1 Tax=unclassified Rhodococcus (in: high G+C Gram-positive bacteria) TaxID=192944 RepID=UPI0020C71B9E|nr:DUF485 domain-containing protein [Rhodococcus sp. W8901]
MSAPVHGDRPGAPASVRWSDILSVAEFVELRRRRSVVTNSLGAAAIVMLAVFLLGFAFLPDLLGSSTIAGVPLSLWLMFSQFAGTWVLVYLYFRLTRTYIQPAADAALAAIDPYRQERSA